MPPKFVRRPIGGRPSPKRCCGPKKLEQNCTVFPVSHRGHQDDYFAPVAPHWGESAIRLCLGCPRGSSPAGSRAKHRQGTHVFISATIGHNKMVNFHTHQRLAHFWSKTCVFLSVFLFCTIPTWPKSTFVQRNSMFWIPPKVAVYHPKTVFLNSADVFKCGI